MLRNANNTKSHSAAHMTERVYRFAGFELNPAEGELRTGNSAVRLQEKPLLLLTTLLDHPQRVVTREQLRARMWDSRTVVEYDQGINAAIKKVRDALGDSADEPRFIETVAKRGYRLLVPVTVVSDEGKVTDVPVPVSAIPTAADESILTPEATGTRRGLLRKRWIVSAATLIAGAIALWLYATQANPGRPAPIHSIAVLPLQDLSPDGAHEYFADGITEEVTTNLAQMLPLRVISRTSAMRYKRTDKPVAQIARELAVEAIVEGSVARSGNRVTVTVQLIDAREDRHLWAEKYERRIEDIMAIEAELSQAIASRISGTLNLQGAAPRIARRVDPQVHELSLLGRYHWNKRTSADLAKAEDYFQRAIALDPAHAPAYAGLADVYALQPYYTATLFDDAGPKAIEAARRALALDDSLAEAHATIGLVRISTRRWTTAAAELRRALELNPNYATAHHWYAYYLMFADRLDEACAEIELARQLDPLSPGIATDQGEMLYAARRYEDAKVSLRRALELAPDFSRAHARMALVALETGHTAQAVEEARAALALDPESPATIGEAGYVFAVGGDIEEAAKLLARLQDRAQHDVTVFLYSAMIQAGLGRTDEALAALHEEAHAPNGIGLQGIQHWHAFDTLSADPRFQQLLSRAR